MNVGEMVNFLKRVDPQMPVEQVIAIRCGKCGDKAPRGARAGDSVEMQAPMQYPTMPTPAARGVEYHADPEQVEGIAANSDVRSWCHHTDEDVTIEVLQTITVPLDILEQIAQAKGDEKKSADLIFNNLGTLIFQTMSCVGWHAGEVDFCIKRGGACRHKAEA